MSISRLRTLTLAAVFAAAGVPALAGTVGGTVAPINTLTSATFNAANTLVGSTGATNTIYTATINNNNENGWALTVSSANAGKLKRGAGGGVGTEITYTNVALVKTSGTLGSGLTDPDGQSKSVVTPAVFNTRPQPANTLATATTATVDYAFSLRITWTSNTALLSGTYSDDVTVTLDNDI